MKRPAKAQPTLCVAAMLSRKPTCLTSVTITEITQAQNTLWGSQPSRKWILYFLLCCSLTGEWLGLLHAGSDRAVSVHGAYLAWLLACGGAGPRVAVELRGAGANFILVIFLLIKIHTAGYTFVDKTYKKDGGNKKVSDFIYFSAVNWHHRVCSLRLQRSHLIHSQI